MTTAALSLAHIRRQPAPVAVGDARPPLLLLLHGVGSNERSMALISDAFDARFEVLSVRSPIALGPNSYAWFHVQFTEQGPIINADEARAGWEHVAQFAHEATAAYGTDPARVYVGGFSQGGIMSLAAMLTAPAIFAGAICMSGRLLPEVLPHAATAYALRDKPVLIVHGTHDTKLGIDFAHHARRELEAFPIALTYHEFAMEHQITDESLTRVSEWLTTQLRERIA